MARKAKTTDQYIEDAKLINPNIEVIGDYIYNYIKILHKRKICGHEWYVRPQQILNGEGCPNCARIKRTKKHDDYIAEVNMVCKDIEVVGEYIGCNIKIAHKCKICGHIWAETPDSILHGGHCPKCYNTSKKEHNRITNKNNYIDTLENKFLNINVIGEYINSNTKILHECKLCGYKWTATPKNVLKSNGCPNCNDGISYPNKFMYSLLIQLKIDYISEYKPEWSDNKRYDIYIPKINCIIENHGSQHFEEHIGKWTRKSLKDEINNDIYKKELANINGIDNYVVIDCRKSKVDWIKNSVMNSTLPQLLNFSETDIDWIQCEQFAISSFIKKASDLWNLNMPTKEIANELKVDIHTIMNYLQIAKNYNWCDYTKEESHKRGLRNISGRNHYRAKKVYCLELDKVFESMTEAKKQTGSWKIYECCNGIRKTTNGQHWYYVYDQVSKSGKEIKGAISLKLIDEERISKI